jgi:malate dehydrogenase
LPRTGIVATTDVAEACKDVNIAVMVGGFPRKEGMERKDVMSKNVSIYKGQASALEQYAAKDVKVNLHIQKKSFRTLEH